jgi:dolichol-phosphate mannosyltransferase
MSRFTAVLPTYNEAENLPLIVSALFSLALEDFHILIVDDHSPDGTGRLADDLAARDKRIEVLHRPQKQGLGPAYLSGFKKALGDGAQYVLQMDSDFSHQPKYIPIMVEKLRENDLVIGSRYVPGGSVDETWGAHRELLSRFANQWYIQAILRFPVRDATAGFRLWRGGTLAGMDLERIKSNGYVFQIEMAYVTHRLGYKIAEIPIHFPNRTRGTSKMSLDIALEAVLRVWQVRARHRRLNRAMRQGE